MLLIALSIFAPQRTADAATLKMQSDYRPKNFERIKSCSPAHYGLHRFAAGKRFSERFLTGFSAPIAKGAHTFFSCAFPLISRIRELFVFPCKSCSPAYPTYFHDRGFRRAAEHPMPAIFRRKAPQNILTATPVSVMRGGFYFLLAWIAVCSISLLVPACKIFSRPPKSNLPV